MKYKIITPILTASAVVCFTLPLWSCGTNNKECNILIDDVNNVGVTITKTKATKGQPFEAELNWPDEDQHPIEEISITIGNKVLIEGKDFQIWTPDNTLEISDGSLITNDINIRIVIKNVGPEPEPETQGLCFSDIVDGQSSKIQLRTNIFGESDLKVNIETSTDGLDWKPWDINTSKTSQSEEITISEGQKLYVRNKENKLSTINGFLYFYTSGALNLSGNVNSMINYSDLTPFCFESLFIDNDSIKSIDGFSLPIDDLTNAAYCYEEMFGGCSNITKVPNNFLPATKLSEGCYDWMFSDCGSLTTLPKDLLPAKTLSRNCYRGMFSDCGSLKIIENSGDQENKIFDCPSSIPDGAVDSMFLNTSGSFKGTPTAGNSYYLETETQELCFSDIEDGSPSTVTFNTVLGGLLLDNEHSSNLGIESDLNIDIETSTDGIDWTTWEIDESQSQAETNPITINDGEKLYVKNNTNTLSTENGYCYFSIDGEVNLSGNVNSMINYSNVTPYCFQMLFWYNSSIKSIDGLSLPANDLTGCDHCYQSMFYDCDGIETLPEGLLPATALSEYCYNGLFGECSNLKQLPGGLLPAETLANYCYYNMFYDCDSLTELPEDLLSAKTLAESCCTTMFGYCDSLSSIPQNFFSSIEVLSPSCFDSMFFGCTSLTNAPKLPDLLLKNFCYYQMFSGCTKLKINISGDDSNKIFTCPNYDSSVVMHPVTDMFTNTGGAFTGTPTAGNTYYWYS